jgi:hypothetical protein
MALTRSGANFSNGYFIPQQYSKKVLLRYYAEDVLPKITNSAYEGDLSGKGKGDTVTIRREIVPIAQDHSVDAELNWQLVTDDKTTLTLAYDKVSPIRLTKEDLMLSDVDLMKMVTDAMFKVHRTEVNKSVLQAAYLSATTTATTVEWQTSTNSSDAMGTYAAQLSALNIPDDGQRWFITHPLALQYLKRQQANWAQNAGTSQGAQIINYVGTYAGFKVFESSLIAGAGTSGNPYKSMAGHKDAISLAAVFRDLEIKDLSNYLGKGVVGQTIFGWGVTQPDALIYAPIRTS